MSSEVHAKCTSSSVASDAPAELGRAGADGVGQFCARELRNRAGEMHDPQRFDTDALADQPRFGEQAAQGLGGCAVAPIDWRERIERRRRHEF
jgi:hypothetical protein